MQIVITPDLAGHMRQVNKPVIIVEIVQSDSSDFEITELHVHLLREKDARFFVEKKRFHSVAFDGGRLLLPNYRLEYDDTLTFGLKKILCFRQVTYQGIRL